MKQTPSTIFKRQWTVSGTIIETNTHQPLKGLRVTVLDMDFILGDDALGEAVTNDEGKYSVTFGWNKFRDILEFLPDVYVKVYDANGKLLKDTKKEVLRNISSDKEINIQIDLGHKTDAPRISGFTINTEAFQRATPKDILGIAQIMRGRKIDDNTARLLQEINPQLSVEGILQSNNFCTTPFRQFIHEALILKKIDRDIWLELDMIFSLDYTGYSSHVYNTANFSISYVLNDGGPSSSDAVAATDTTSNIVLPGTTTVVGTTTGGNGVPDFVEKVGFWLEYALNKYINLPYSLRNPASGGRIPVTIENEGGPNGHATPTAFFIHNSMSDDLIAAISCHELFHMVQFQYNAWMSPGEWAPGMTEGGAVLAEDALFDSHNRYIVQATQSGGTIASPQNTLSNATYRYQLALFLKYIAEQHSGRVNPGDEPMIGVEAYTAMITRCDTMGYTTAAIKSSLSDLPFYQDFYEFGYLDPARLDLTSSETTLGNFHLALYLKDLGVNIPDKRFDFMEDEEDATWDNIFIGSNLVNTLGSVAITTNTTLPDGGSVNLSGSVNPFAAKYYIVRPNSAVSTLRVDFSTTGTYTQPVFQVVQFNADGTLRDIHRTDKTSYQKTIANMQGGQLLDRIVLVVTGTVTGGSYTLNVSEVADSPDVMITRWDSPVGKEYMIDSFNWGWTWGSPDVWVDNEDDGIANSSVFFNQDNHLYVRLRNKGLATASGVQVDFWYQDASGGLSDAGWQPVKNTALAVQSLTGITIAPGGTYSGYVNWAPVPSGTSHHFCVRVVVTCPGDPNTDNNRCTNNFGHVIAYSPYFDLSIRKTNFSDKAAMIEQVVIPRLRNNLVVSELDAALQQHTELKPGEIAISKLRIIQSKRISTVTNDKSFVSPCLDGKLSRRRPDINGYYKVPASILPPGAEKFDMITITHLIDGKVAGGYSYTLEVKEKGKE